MMKLQWGREGETIHQVGQRQRLSSLVGQVDPGVYYVNHVCCIMWLLLRCATRVTCSYLLSVRRVS